MIFSNHKLLNSTLEAELSVYYRNHEYLENTKRSPIKEYFRWLFFSFIVIIRGLFVVKVQLKKVGVYGSYNTKFSILSIRQELDLLDIFGDVIDAQKFRRFYILLFVRLLRMINIFFKIRAYQDKNYLAFISELYDEMLFCWLQTLKGSSIRKIYISNDHLFYNRALIVAANEIPSIEVAYVQHGAIGRFFPHLNHFAELHMHNQFSFMRYPGWKTYAGKLHLRQVSQPSFVQVNSSGKILICLNNYREINAFSRLLDQLSEHKERIHIRCHKYIDPNKVRLLKDLHCKIETINDRPFHEAAKDANIVIGGNSTILVDAMCLGVRCIYVALAPPHDYYGFVEHGIVPEYHINDSIDVLFQSVTSFNFDQAINLLCSSGENTNENC